MNGGFLNNLGGGVKIVKKRYGVEVIGVCRICGREAMSTEMHHIISRNQIKHASKKDLLHLVSGIIRSGTPIIQENPSEEELRKYAINNLPGNIVELCGGCHDMTASSEMWRYHQMKREKRKSSRRNRPRRSRESTRKKREEQRKKKGLFQCEGRTVKGQRCEKGVKEQGSYCKTHASQDPSN